MEVLPRTTYAIQRKARELGLRTGAKRSYTLRLDRRALLLDYLKDNPGIRLTHLAIILKRHERTIRMMVKRLQQEGFIINTGTTGGHSYFQVTTKWKDRIDASRSR